MKRETRQDYHGRMLRVLVHIQRHLDHALCLEDLARVACFSPFHFHRVFRGMVGEGVAEHVRRLRLERAAFRLKHGEDPVTRIAFEAGYETHESFTRAFHALFGCPPSEFRKTHRPIAYAPSPSGVHYVEDGEPGEFRIVETGGTTMDVRIERMQPTRVAFMRHVGPYPTVGATWMKFMTWAGMRGLLGPSTVCMGLMHDDPEVTPPEKIRCDTCIPVGPEVRPEGEVGVQEIAGGDYAVTRHVGPYEKLSETYAALCGGWLPASRRELRSAPCFEIYRNNPQTTPPDQLVTDIHMPLEQE